MQKSNKQHGTQSDSVDDEWEEAAIGMANDKRDGRGEAGFKAVEHFLVHPTAIVSQ